MTAINITKREEDLDKYLAHCEKSSEKALSKLRNEESEEDIDNPQLAEEFDVKLTGRQILWISKATEDYFEKLDQDNNKLYEGESSADKEEKSYMFHKTWGWMGIRNGFRKLAEKINNKSLKMKD